MEDQVVDDANEIVKQYLEKYRQSLEESAKVDFSKLTYDCEVCGMTNPIANIGCCDNCGC